MVDVRGINPGFDHQLGQQGDEPVHLCAARDSAAQALVGAAGGALFLRLSGAGLPVELHGFARVFRPFGEDGQRRHLLAVWRGSENDSTSQ